MAKNKNKKVFQLPTSPEDYIKTRARNLPIGKCYINEGWADSGFASIVVSRNHINGNFTFAVFLVDLYCLGVKDTFYDFNVHAEFAELLDKFKAQQEMKEIDYALAHNIIYGAVEYAEDLGFKPDKDFEISQYLLEEDDDHVEFIDIDFGLNGKPAVFMWKEAHPENIIATLDRNIGEGNFTIFSGQDIEDDYEDEDNCEEEDGEDLSIEDIADIMEGKKKASPRNFARIVFALYNEQCTEKESAEMNEIMEDADTWEIVDEDETDEPFSLNEEKELIYDSLFEKIHENPANAIPEIEAMIAKYPDEYYFYDLLSLAYSKENDNTKQDETVILTYQKFPDNIFAFTNYILISIAQRNFDELKKLIGVKFDFHHYFPNRQKISFEELVALAGALFAYFSEATKDLHMAVAYAMPLTSFIFYDKKNKQKADEILSLSTQIMFSEIARENNFDDEVNGNL